MPYGGILVVNHYFNRLSIPRHPAQRVTAFSPKPQNEGFCGGTLLAFPLPLLSPSSFRNPLFGVMFSASLSKGFTEAFLHNKK